ncbi:MAG: hypothetical protein GF335_04815 [Candidatus Moranbacteria bacterium]|nr:hypothetical protein [Candidatus Moranbacteria bacterium]
MNQEETPKNNQNQLSLISLILAGVLAIILILFLQKAVFDLNAYINPIIIDNPDPVEQNEKEFLFNSEIFRKKLQEPDLKMDSKGFFSKDKVYYKQNQEKPYLIYKIIIYACLVIPFFIASFILYKIKNNNSRIKPILLAFLGASLWMLLKLFFLAADFVATQYENISSYLILLFLAAIFGYLIYKNQTRYQQKK